MGVEIKVDDLTKSFGKQLIWGDVTLTIPAGEICVMLGPSGTGKSVLPQDPHRPAQARQGLDHHRGHRHRLAAPRRSSTRSASCSACCSRTARCSAR